MFPPSASDNSPLQFRPTDGASIGSEAAYLQLQRADLPETGGAELLMPAPETPTILSVSTPSISEDGPAASAGILTS